MIRYPLLACFALLCIATGALGQGPFLTVNMDQVAGQKNAIEREFVRAARVKKVVIGTALTVGTVLLYRWMNKDLIDGAKPLVDYGFGITLPAIFKRDRDLRNVQQGVDELKKDVDLIVRHEVALNHFLQDKGYAVGAPLTWGQTVRSWASWCGNLVTMSFFSTIASASMSPLLKYFKAFDTAFDGRMNAWFPEKSMKWYLVHRVSLPQAFAQLEHGAKQLVHASSHDRLQEFIVSWQIFIMQMERLLGFIQYRMNELDPLCQKRAVQIFNRIHQEVDQASVKLNESCAAQSTERQPLLDGMRTVLDQELHTFIEIEAII